MIYTQPVVHEFGLLRVPTLLLIGERDNTAPGKDAAAPEVAATLGHYATLGPAIAKAIPGSRLVSFADLGGIRHKFRIRNASIANSWSSWPICCPPAKPR